MAGASTLTYDSSPDLKLLFAKAVVNGRFSAGALPSTEAVRRGVTVDLDHVIDYARVCGFSVGAHLPMPYPHVLGFPLQVALMSRRDFPLPLVGLVHIENVITWTRPLTPDDVLDLRVSSRDFRPHRSGRAVDLVTEVSVDGETVWAGVSTYLARGRRDETVPASEPPDTGDLARIAGGATWRLDEGTGRRYAAVSGDVNPIHLHALTARALGFSSAIAHGMFTYAKMIAALGPQVPAAGTSHAWFRKPVKVPGTVLLKVAPDARTAVLLPRQGDGQHVVVVDTPPELRAQI